MDRQKRLGKKVVEVEPSALMDASEALKRCICEASILAAEEMDWMQVVLNQSAPCFHIDADYGGFCGRTEKWHEDGPHKFLPLAELLRLFYSTPQRTRTERS